MGIFIKMIPMLIRSQTHFSFSDHNVTNVIVNKITIRNVNNKNTAKVNNKNTAKSQ